MQTPLQWMQPLRACLCTEQYQYSVCRFCFTVSCVHKNANSRGVKEEKHDFRVFSARKWNVLELSVITRSPAISAFILFGQLVTRTSNKVTAPIASKPFVNLFIPWTKAVLWKHMQITHCIRTSLQKAQKAAPQWAEGSECAAGWRLFLGHHFSGFKKEDKRGGFFVLFFLIWMLTQMHWGFL